MATFFKRDAHGTSINASNALRRSQFSQRYAEKSASEIEAREAETYSTELDSATDTFTRRDNADVSLDEKQEQAVEMVLHNQFGVIAGYAGTGKTTTMKKIVKTVAPGLSLIDWTAFRTAGNQFGSERLPAIALCCFTNVAARNLASKLDPEWSPHCMSIHALLAYAPTETEDFDPETGRAKIRFEPRYNSTNKLPIEVLFIDEAGIVSSELWKTLMDAVQPSTRIYFLGDLAQLPAMHGASPMPFAIEKWPTVVLDKIYRQADGSPIIENLTRIRRGMEPVHNPSYFRCGPQETLPVNAMDARKHVAGYLSALYKLGHWDPKQDIIITPQNEAMLGQEHWNGAFHTAFNPARFDDHGKRLNPPILVGTALGGNMLCVGDKVMAMDNGGRTAVEKRFVNGSIGIIVAIKPNPRYTGDPSKVGELVHNLEEDAFDWDDTNSATVEIDPEEIEHRAAKAQAEDDEETKSRQASHIVTVVEQATGELFELSRSAEIASLGHAYAATCHKFQGSQARNVLVICHSSMNFGLNREWLYTACSRAQQRVFLLHDPKALQKAVSRQQLVGRNPEEKAARLREIYKARPWATPRLPDNRSI